MQINQEKNKIIIRGQNRNILASFELKDNLTEALRLLKKINQVSTTNDVKIYNVVKYKNYSIWSFGQQNLFWNQIRFFIKFRPVIKFLMEKNIKEIKIKKLENIYINFLKLYKIKFLDRKKIFLRKKENFSLFIVKKIAFLISKLAICYAKAKKIQYLIYTPDKYSNVSKSDFRFAPVYNFLRKKRVNYLEIFHTLLDKNFLNNFVKRKRVAIYLEVFEYKNNIKKRRNNVEFNLSSFNGVEQIFVRNILNDYLLWSQKSLFLIKKLTQILSRLKIKKLIAIDDPRYTNELIIACRENNIETIGIQHGHFTKYSVGWMNYNIPPKYSVTFDKLYVWNSYWRQVLLDYSSQYNEDNIEIGGILRKPKEFNLLKRKKVNSLLDLNILVLSEPLSNKEEVGKFIDDLIDNGVKIFLSLRPDNLIKDPLASYNLKNRNKVKLVYKIDEELLNKVDLVAGTYSTFLNEILYYGKPVIVFDTSMKHGHRLIEDGLALLVKLGKYREMLDYVNSYHSKKNIVWPKPYDIRKTLEKIIQ